MPTQPTTASRDAFLNPLRCAVGRADITPPDPVPLAGVEGRTQCWRSVTTALEANALLLTDVSGSVLMISADLLYFGPDLVDAIHRIAAQFDIPSARVVLAASHTHFAPATDKTKPRLGAVDSAYLAFVEERIGGLVASVVGAPKSVVTIETARVATALSINRRRRWRLPTLTREGFKFGPNIVMAPAPDEPRDEFIDVLKFVDERDQVVCITWKFACHPVCFPGELSVSAEFPGHARKVLRQQIERDIPILFLQGFTGDVRPMLLGTRSLKDRLQVLRRGPGFGEVSMAQWTQWADQIAHALCQAARERPSRAIGTAMTFACGEVSMAKVLDPGSNPQATERALQLQRIAFGDDVGDPLELLFVSAEVCSPYLKTFDAGPRTLCVGYTGHVFGYLPSQRQAAEGGYEGRSFFALFGLFGQLQAGFERAVVEAVLRLRTPKSRVDARTERVVDSTV